MPAYSSHYIFACEMMNRLEELSMEKLNHDAVIFGTQGPDIFFFHRALPFMFGKSRRAVGSALHRSLPSAIFGAMADYVRGNENNEIALSYAYGFMCHYALDRNAHPFVYGLQKQIGDRKKWLKGFTIHNKIEFSIDNVMLSKKLNVAKPYKFNTAQTVPDDEVVINEIGKMLCCVVEKVTHEKLTFSEAVTALRDTKVMQRMTNDKSRMKSLLIKSAETVLFPFLGGFKISVMIRPRSLEKSLDFVNDTHNDWVNPEDELTVRRESFFELYDVALNECGSLIMAFNDAVKGKNDLAKVTMEKSFLTGLPII